MKDFPTFYKYNVNSPFSQLIKKVLAPSSEEPCVGKQKYLTALLRLLFG
jgi:hypothetical protein